MPAGLSAACCGMSDTVVWALQLCFLLHVGPMALLLVSGGFEGMASFQLHRPVRLVVVSEFVGPRGGLSHRRVLLPSVADSHGGHRGMWCVSWPRFKWELYYVPDGINLGIE